MEQQAPDHIHYKVYEPEGIATKAAILLLHGMQEHSGRYEAFSSFLKGQGYAVVTYDHVGHGRTAKTKEQLGFFQRKNPEKLLVDEAIHMSHFVQHRFAGIPRILMGHSMGSFVTRIVLKDVSYLFQGAILTGTGGPNPMAALSRPILYMANLFAPEKRSRWLNGLFLSINNRKFKHEEPNDGTNWLSAGMANRKAFLADELCGVDFSNNAFYGLISLNAEATKSSWADNIPKHFPLLFASGDDDPIGNFGKGIRQTTDALIDKGFLELDMKLYPGMRHEILNEDDRQLVFNDIVSWLDKTVWTIKLNQQ